MVLINASYGLGENVVQGSVNPDEYCVFKPTLKTGHRPILQKRLGNKEFKLVYDVGGGKMVKNVPVPAGGPRPVRARRRRDPDAGALGLRDRGPLLAEDGPATPMDIEWAKDGRTGELFIVQARPETVQSRKARDVLEIYRLKSKGRPLVSGPQRRREDRPRGRCG